MSLPALADQLSRDAAREAAVRELSRRQYQEAEPSPVVRLLAWLLQAVGRLLSHAAGLGRGVAGVLLVALLVLVVAVVLVRLGPLGRRPAPGRAVFDNAGTTAGQHRAAAQEAAAQGHWAEAVRERLRAVVRELETRGVLDARPGRTAAELAGDGGRAVPVLAEDLRAAAELFDEVWYGERTATAGSYEVLVRLDDRIRGTRLVPA